MRDDKICWVDFEPETTGKGKVRDAYANVAEKDGHVHNLYKAMSLAPETIGPADELYRHLMHGTKCPLEPWLRELIATQAALIAECDYAFAHHAQNFHDLSEDCPGSAALLDSVRNGTWPNEIADIRLKAILSFNDKLTRSPELMLNCDVETLRGAGVTDEEVVYLTQISAAFAYWVRVINGLGISLGDEPVGLSKQDQGDEDEHCRQY